MVLGLELAYVECRVTEVMQDILQKYSNYDFPEVVRRYYD